IAPGLRPGMHAATFGGNPIAASAGIATIEMIERDDLLGNAKRLEQLFLEKLRSLRRECGVITDIRVCGLMIGIELAVEGAPVVRECMQRKLLVNCTHTTVIRLLPAMNLTEELAEEGCAVLGTVLKEMS